MTQGNLLLLDVRKAALGFPCDYPKCRKTWAVKIFLAVFLVGLIPTAPEMGDGEEGEEEEGFFSWGKILNFPVKSWKNFGLETQTNTEVSQFRFSAESRYFLLVHLGKKNKIKKSHKRVLCEFLSSSSSLFSFSQMILDTTHLPSLRTTASPTFTVDSG